MKKRFHKRLNRSFGGHGGYILFLFAGALFMLLPTIYAVSAAFKPLDEIYIFPPRLFVRRPTLDNFVQVGVLGRHLLGAAFKVCFQYGVYKRNGNGGAFWSFQVGGVSACRAQLCGQKSFFKYC